MVEEDITVGIKAFKRPSKLSKVLKSIRELDSKPVEVIIADDSPDKQANKKAYKEFTDELNITYLSLENDVGASKCRNRIVRETGTEYLFLLDDDQYLSRGCFELKNVLEENKELAGIAPSFREKGEVISDARDIRRRNGWVIADIYGEKTPYKDAGICYYIYDFIATCGIYRTEVIEEGWDEEFVIGGEHLDFFLNYKENTDWKFAITEDVVVEHDPGPGENLDYIDDRRNPLKLQQSRKYFCQKWGAKGFVFKRKHDETYNSILTLIATKIFYAMPTVLHWELKKTGLLDKIKSYWCIFFEEEFR